MYRKHLHRNAVQPGFLLAVMLLATFLLPAPLAAHSNGDEKLPGTGLEERLGAKIPLDLTFRDETGRTVRLRDLVTGPTIILPVYYSCTNECNLLQGGLASILAAVKRTPEKEYRVISLSFDETETPAMAARAKRMHLGSMNSPFPADGWRFLTGDPPNIHRLTDAAGYRFQRKGHEFIHPVASFVIAGDGTIVRYFYGTNFLAKDVTLALLEARSGTVGTAIRRVVGFCFSFDPAGKTYVFNLLRVSATVVFLTAGGFLGYLVLSGRKGRTRNRSPH
jgi:protein SCO1